MWTTIRTGEFNIMATKQIPTRKSNGTGIMYVVVYNKCVFLYLHNLFLGEQIMWNTYKREMYWHIRVSPNWIL